MRPALADISAADKHRMFDYGVAMAAQNNVDLWASLGKDQILAVANMSECDDQINLRTEFSGKFDSRWNWWIPKKSAGSL